MIKKTFIFLFIFSVVATVGVLFTPFSFFQDRLLVLANSTEYLEVKISSPIKYRLINPDKFSAENIEIKVAGYEIKLNKFSIVINLDSFLTKDIIIEDLLLKVESIKKYDETGQTNKKYVGEVAAPQDRFNSILLKNFNMTVESMDLSGHLVSDLSLSSKGSTVLLAPFSVESELDLRIFDNLLDGKIKITKGDIHSFEVDLRVEEVSRFFSNLKFDGINLDGNFRLRANGTIDPELKLISNKMNLLIRAEDMKWRGRDLDKILDAYIDSRQIGLLDTAGYLALGPLGILVAKGKSLGQAGIQGLVEGETHIRKLNAAIDFVDGIASFRDVAVATKSHKVVAKGKINLKTKFFDKFSVASVDDSGCSIFIQKINGVLTKPEVSAVGAFVDEVFSPITGLFKRGVSFVSGRCNNYYQGVVD